MARPIEYLNFQSRFEQIVGSKGQLCFPNIVEITDPQNALNVINRASFRLGVEMPYEFCIQKFDPPRGHQTHEMAWYAKIFKNGRGMGGSFDGSGAILASPRHDGVARVFTFALCEHEWDTSGANPSRGWHRSVCTKCGFDASIDSGD